MPVRRPRYSKDEAAQRGKEIYERVRPHVEKDNQGKVAAIDIESEAFEVGEDAIVASDRLLAKNPDAQIWFVRIGVGPHRFGSRPYAKPGLIYKHDLRIQAVEDGRVTIEAMP